MTCTKRTYKGIASTDGSRTVTLNGESLTPRLDLKRLSKEFDWGIRSDGASQLSFAILAENDNVALEHYEAFYSICIARIRQNESWTLTENELEGDIEVARSSIDELLDVVMSQE